MSRVWRWDDEGAGLVTSLCILCPPRGDDDQGHPPEPGWRCCWRAHDRMAAALRDIPVLVDELAGLGYVERDVRQGTRAVRDGDRIVRVPAPADPVAHLWPAGPTNGASSQPRVGGSALPSVPIRIDPTDLLAPARPATLAIADTGHYASDQIGYLSVATELEFWARDWADLLGHHLPLPTVPELARWLLNRLEWACAIHPALDEFAGKLRHLRSTLTAACGRSEPRPEALEAPCPGCGQLALWRDPDLESIACGCCPVLLSEESYADHVNQLIEEAS